MELTHDKSSDELMRAQTLLSLHSFNYVDSMSLKCAVELGIADAIHRHGKPMALSDLLPALSISQAKASPMRRLMRMLTHSGIFARIRNTNDDEGDEDDLYSLTPLSSLLVRSEDVNLSNFVLTVLHPIFMNSFQSMSAWFKSGDEAAAPFGIQHGCGIWDLTARDPEFNEVFNKGTESDSKFFIDAILKNCRHVFEGIDSLIDVGGGIGTAAIAISKAFPNIKCSVLDLPQVIDTATGKNDTVDFIAGDMFDFIPPADVVFLKWILHDWNDENCVKILKRCKEAISSSNKGKVIIIDQVTGSDSSCPKSTTTQLYYDITVMALYGAVERAEHEWKKIFLDAGFKNYKMTPALGLRSVIELYP